MTQHRITTNAKPADGHLPADWHNPRRGTIRLTLLIVGIWAAGTLAVVAIFPAGSAGIGSPDAQPASVVEPGAGVGGGG